MRPRTAPTDRRRRIKPGLTNTIDPAVSKPVDPARRERGQSIPQSVRALSTSLAIDVFRNRDSGVTVVSLVGVLTLASVPELRRSLLACAEEYPAAVIVNLAALHADAEAVGVLATVSRRALREWGVPLLLCGASADVARKLAPHQAFVRIYPGIGDAVRALRGRLRWAHRRLAPNRVSAALARGLTDGACVAWNLPKLRRPARLIVSELADNAIQHARTDFDVTVTHTAAHLRIAVEDGDRAPLRLLNGPPPGSALPLVYQGRGLHTVEDTAVRWGTTPRVDGKIVWAVLDAPVHAQPSPAAASVSRRLRRPGTPWPIGPVTVRSAVGEPPGPLRASSAQLR